MPNLEQFGAVGTQMAHMKDRAQVPGWAGATSLDDRIKTTLDEIQRLFPELTRCFDAMQRSNRIWKDEYGVFGDDEIIPGEYYDHQKRLKKMRPEKRQAHFQALTLEQNRILMQCLTAKARVEVVVVSSGRCVRQACAQQADVQPLLCRFEAAEQGLVLDVGDLEKAVPCLAECRQLLTEALTLMQQRPRDECNPHPPDEPLPADERPPALALLRKYQKENDLLDKDLAHRLGGVSVSHLSRILSGKRPISPEMGTVIAALPHRREP